MSSNLYKYGYNYIKNGDKRVIDNSAAMAALEQKVGRTAGSEENQGEDGFRGGLTVEEIELLTEDGYEENVALQEPVYEGPTPEELLEQAKEEIVQMKQAAEAENIVLQKKVMDQARTQGYQEGFEKAKKESDALKRQLNLERQRLKEEYEEKFSTMESQLVSVLTEIYEHIFQVDFTSYRQVIVTLISNTLHQIEGGKNYIIHVSSSDYPYVTLHKTQIISNCPASVLVEFVEDISLKENECLIETDTGIFDCGLGTQLEELKQKLKLLSFER